MDTQHAEKEETEFVGVQTNQVHESFLSLLEFMVDSLQSNWSSSASSAAGEVSEHYATLSELYGKVVQNNKNGAPQPESLLVSILNSHTRLCKILQDIRQDSSKKLSAVPSNIRTILPAVISLNSFITSELGELLR